MSVRDAVETIWVSDGPELRKIAAGIAGSPADGDDLVAEAFARALIGWERSGIPDNPAAWLQRVMVNLERSRWRRARTAVLHRSLVAAPLTSPDWGPDRVAIAAALKALPRVQREALTLHYLADLPIAEIAALVDAPVGTIKARLARGRAALALTLDDGAENPAPADRQEAESHG